MPKQKLLANQFMFLKKQTRRTQMLLTPVTKLSYDQFIGRKLFKRRKQLKLTQTKVAKIMGLTFQQVQKYEKGTNIFSAPRIRSLSTALRIPKKNVGFLIWKYNKKNKGRL